MDNIGKELVDEVERLSSDEHIIGLYDGELHEKRIRNSIINDAIEKGFEKALKEEKLNIAKKLISMNMRIEDISKATELSINEIKKLRQ